MSFLYIFRTAFLVAKRSKAWYNTGVKYLGVDYGDKRVGIAVSYSGILAEGLTVLQPRSMRDAIDRVAGLCTADTERIIVGLPLNMDGSEGDRASKTRAFGRVLEKVSGVKVEYFDERLTSIEADGRMVADGLRRDKRKAIIDKVAAQIILQTYLDCNKKQGE